MVKTTKMMKIFLRLDADLANHPEMIDEVRKATKAKIQAIMQSFLFSSGESVVSGCSKSEAV